MSCAANELLPELTSFIEGLAEPRILVDLDYRILAANKAYRDAFAAHESVVGRRCYEVSHHYTRPCDEAGESCPRRSALASRRTEHVLHIHHTPRGDEHVQVELNPVRDSSGEIRLFVERMQSLPTARATASSHGLIGRSPRFREMLDLAARVAPTETSVLLLGETGTGKEMVTRLIHEGSRRSAAPLVAVDCSGLTETLFESELFGHEEGAFTGATSRTIGLVEAASGGTLFLDEVGDISLAQQVKLLRLIESSTYRRVGGVTPLRSDFRLVAATHRDLKAMVRAGTFRSDLYYRISAFPIHVPTLRERRDDILLLTESLLGRIRPGQAFSLAEDARQALVAYDYPGNVRELRNIVERATLLAGDGVIGMHHLAEEVVSRDASAAAGVCDTAGALGGIPFRSLDRQTLARALEEHRGNRRDLAASLGTSERTLYRRLREFGLARRTVSAR
jgi:transcriptional regulator with PAS, ATPase and Fis domain